MIKAILGIYVLITMDYNAGIDIVLIKDDAVTNTIIQISTR